MKLSKTTLEILKNFSSINPSIYIKKGDVVNTLSPHDVIFAEAQVAETFPEDFAIYNLPGLLGGLQSLLAAEPDFEFKKTHVLITTPDQRKMKVMYADPSTVKVLNKKIKMPSDTVSFNIEQSDLAALIKSSSLMDVPDLSIKSDGETVTMTAYDAKNESLGDFSVKTAQAVGKSFEIVLKFENLMIMSAPYTVEASGGVVQFTHKHSQLKYWIPVESNSGF